MTFFNPTITMTPSSLLPAPVGIPFYQKITTDAGNNIITAYIIGNSNGLSVATVPGQDYVILSGTPVASGTFQFTVVVSDSYTYGATQY